MGTNSGDAVREALCSACYLRKGREGPFIGCTCVCGRVIGDPEAAAALATPQAAPADARVLAERFHEAYERLAPSFGYETRPETRKFDPDSPNGRLMIAVCAELAHAAPVVREPVAFIDYRTLAYFEDRRARGGYMGTFAAYSSGEGDEDLRPLYAHPPVTTDGGAK